MNQFRGKRITVMGLGRFGGGVGVVRWLAARGAHVLVSDSDQADSLAHSIAAIQPLISAGAVSLALGSHETHHFTDTDAVVANAAVPTPWANPFLAAAASRGVPILTEIGLAVAQLPSRSRIIGITGSVGKSTTTALIQCILSANGLQAIAGGNLGGSLLTDLESGSITTDTWVVLELSSAMLHWLAGWSPATAVVTTIENNHVDWHGTIDHYRSSKQNILRSQAPGDLALLGPTVAQWPTASGVRSVRIPADAGVTDLIIPGAHNAWNAAVAVEAVINAVPSISRPAAEAASRSFSGLPHRLEFVGQHANIRFYNDSKSTTPGATSIAVHSFAPGSVHLIAGGYDKKIDLTPIAALGPRLAGLYTIGATGPTIAELAADCPCTRRCESLDNALSAATERARPGEVVLLSPGCASWDQFTNFEARGDLFRALVAAHARQGVAL